jgi:uncharacterized membrane protein YebE (DUF533 family)
MPENYTSLIVMVVVLVLACGVIGYRALSNRRRNASRNEGSQEQAKQQPKQQAAGQGRAS